MGVQVKVYIRKTWLGLGVQGLGFRLLFAPHLPLQTKIPIPLYFGCHTYFSKAPLNKATHMKNHILKNLNVIRRSTPINAFTIHKNSLKFENRFLIGKKPIQFIKHFLRKWHCTWVENFKYRTKIKETKKFIQNF